MCDYNYREEELQDILNYIHENDISAGDFDSRDDMCEQLDEKLWAEDSVTGNGSGSYWFSRYKAEEALCHNWNLIAEAMSEGILGSKELKEGAESVDVAIRCYLLGECVSAAVDKVWVDKVWDDDDDDDDDE